jgi:hypothetical protein
LLEFAVLFKALTPLKQQYPHPTPLCIHLDGCLVIFTFTNQVHQLATLQDFLRKLGIKLLGVFTDPAYNTGLLKLPDEAAGPHICAIYSFSVKLAQSSGPAAGVAANYDVNS